LDDVKLTEEEISYNAPVDWMSFPDTTSIFKNATIQKKYKLDFIDIVLVFRNHYHVKIYLLHCAAKLFE
jgi:hypothetical protein